MFFFPIFPEDIYASIVGESMHDVPLIFEFHLLCMVQNKSLTLNSKFCALELYLWHSGQNNWVAGEMKSWLKSEVARSKVKRLCIERGWQHPDFEGAAVVKG